VLVPESPLAGWENFYVIVGSSAGALTGLQFVTMALIAETEAAGSMTTIRAFGTPTVVHFCAALLISGILSMPWTKLASAGVALGVCGILGAIYSATVLRHARRQTGYKPEAEDWLWYVIVPIGVYLLLAVDAFMLARHSRPWMFVTGVTDLLLVFLGIRNSWDTVTYIAVGRRRNTDPASETKP
jgi:hypothetical protein